MIRESSKEARFTSLELSYIRFLDGLLERGAMSEDQGMALLSSELAQRPNGTALLPVSSGLFRTITSQLRRGCRHIAIWTDELGRRYITADPPP